MLLFSRGGGRIIGGVDEKYRGGGHPPHKIRPCQYLKSMSYWSLCEDYLKRNPEPPAYLNEACEWLDLLFTRNRYSEEKRNIFFASFIVIADKQLTKINSFVLQGETNSGKSLLMNLLTKPMRPTVLMRQGDASQFYLQNLVNATACLFEEPMITALTVNTMKLIMGGEPCVTDVKNQQSHMIERLPCFFTTNTPLAVDCDSIHRNALMSRSLEFRLNARITSTHTIGSVPAAPVKLTPSHIIHYMRLYKKAIDEHIPAITSVQ